MRRWSLMMFALVFTALGCRQTSTEMTAASRAAVAEEVRAAVDAYFAAQNAHDTVRVFESYLQREDFAYLGVTRVMVGYDRFRSTVANWYRNRPDITFEHEVQLIQVLSPTAAVATVRGSSSDQEWLLFTQVYVLNDAGRWVIAHEHVSWPGAAAPRRHPGTAEMPELPEGVEP